MNDLGSHAFPAATVLAAAQSEEIPSQLPNRQVQNEKDIHMLCMWTCLLVLATMTCCSILDVLPMYVFLAR